MKVYFEEKSCVMQQSVHTEQLTPDKLKQLRTSISKTEKEIGNLRQMANSLQNMRDTIY